MTGYICSSWWLKIPKIDQSFRNPDHARTERKPLASPPNQGGNCMIHLLPRREREIAEIVYARGEASADDICVALGDPLSNAAVRSMLRRIQAKGVIRRRKEGKKYLYSAAHPDRAAREAALRRVSQDYFDGSLALTARALAEMVNREIRSEMQRETVWRDVSRTLDETAHP
jgi:predicted transcriptional regulator